MLMGAPAATSPSILMAQGTPPTSQFGCGVLAAEDGADRHDLLLEIERLQIMRHRHQVGFRRQQVGRIGPIAVLERAKLAALHELLQRFCTSRK